MLRYLIKCKELMKQDTQNGMKYVRANVDETAVLAIINNAGMMINAHVNANNYLIKVYVKKDLLGILVIVSVNVINHVMSISIQTIKTVSV